MGEHPAGGFPWQGTVAGSVKVSVSSSEPTGSGTASHDHNCTASRVSATKPKAVSATSPCLIDQLMTPTSLSLPFMVNRESWGLCFRGSKPSLSTIGWVHLVWLGLGTPLSTAELPPRLRIIPPRAVNSGRFMNFFSSAWGADGASADQGLRARNHWSEGAREHSEGTEYVLFSAPSHNEHWLTPAVLLQCLCTLLSVMFWGIDISLAYYAPDDGEFICNSFGAYLTRRVNFSKGSSCVA